MSAGRVEVKLAMAELREAELEAELEVYVTHAPAGSLQATVCKAKLEITREFLAKYSQWGRTIQ